MRAYRSVRSRSRSRDRCPLARVNVDVGVGVGRRQLVHALRARRIAAFCKTDRREERASIAARQDTSPLSSADFGDVPHGIGQLLQARLPASTLIWRKGLVELEDTEARKLRGQVRMPARCQGEVSCLLACTSPVALSSEA